MKQTGIIGSQISERSKFPSYKSFTIRNYRKIPQLKTLSEEQKFALEVVGRIIPFKTNNYVVDQLINWDDVPYDPMFILNFPQKRMLLPHYYKRMAKALRETENNQAIDLIANAIRMQLNPHPAGQKERNIPMFDNQKLTGMQHKYKETVLFFPSHGQTCHAYCSFCFRWPQFVGFDSLKFAMKDVELLIEYVRRHPQVTDILFTGGDPMIMTARKLAYYFDALLEADLPNLKNIRIGTKSLSFWPYKFVTDNDADDILRLFERVTNAGKHLAIMAHFNHWRELSTDIVKQAIKRIQATGAEIRTQSPLLAHINDESKIWSHMWRLQVSLGLIPYYMFIARNTGCQHYFGLPLVKAWEIFREAYQDVSGLSRTVRGPCMSTDPGKIEVLGVVQVKGQKVIALRMLQGRNPDCVLRPFFAEYDEKAIWLNELKPALGNKSFFFENE